MQQRAATTMIVRGDLAAPTAVVEIAAIASVPDRSDAWVRMTLARDITPPVQLRIDRAEELICRDGWRGNVVIGVVHSAEQILEYRCGVYLRLFDDLGTSVLVRAGAAGDLDAAMRELLPQVVAGSPDWRADGEVVALSQLFGSAP